MLGICLHISRGESANRKAKQGKEYDFCVHFLRDGNGSSSGNDMAQNVPKEHPAD